jgi:hypothetical protein
MVPAMLSGFCGGMGSGSCALAGPAMNSTAAIAKPCLGTRSIMGYLHVLSAKRLQCARHFKVGAADASQSLKAWKSVHSVGCCPFLDEAEGENFDDFIKEKCSYAFASSAERMQAVIAS